MELTSGRTSTYALLLRSSVTCMCTVTADASTTGNNCGKSIAGKLRVKASIGASLTGGTAQVWLGEGEGEC